MSVGNFNTTNMTFRQLLGNGLLFTVPHYQRDYSWGEEEWEELWSDIIDIVEEKDDNGIYLGYLVFKTANNRNFEIIDGQQRLITLSILILSILKYIKSLAETGIQSEDNTVRLEALRNAYIGGVDPVSLMTRAKIVLNRHNNFYFREQIAPLGKIQDLPNNHRSNILLRNAFHWFESKITAYFENRASGEEAAKLIDRLVDKFFFTVISVSNELNAYKVFETLNARGVKFSNSDLIKNHLFQTAFYEQPDEAHFQLLQESWERLSDNIGEGDFNNFIRIHWISRNGNSKEKSIYRTIRDNIATSSRVFLFMRELHEDSTVYLALSQAETDFQWTPVQKQAVDLLRKFNEALPWAMFMAILPKFTSEDGDKAFKAVSHLIFRYSVIGQRNRNELERVFNHIITKLKNEEIKSARELILELKPIYISDAAFKADFSEKSMKTGGRQGSIVKYILMELEKQISSVDYNRLNTKYTIEHIFPQNPEDNWHEFNAPGAKSLTYRLGNMMLLEQTLNKEIGNQYFIGRKPFYEKSVFKMTKDLCMNYNDWTPKNILKRQKEMAQIAAGLWKIQELSGI